jgi:hypothetical protein
LALIHHGYPVEDVIKKLGVSAWNVSNDTHYSY